MYLNKLWAYGVTLVTSFSIIRGFQHFLFQHLYISVFSEPEEISYNQDCSQPKSLRTREGTYISMNLTLS